MLVDSRAVVERHWRRWAALRGLDPEPFLRVAHGRRSRDTLQAVAPELDIEREVRWIDDAETADTDGLTAVAGAAALVSALPPDRWAVVTSGGPALARRRLECTGIPLPAVFITSDDVTRGKPDPEGYLLAARRLGRDAATCVVFEDAPPGVAAARAAGARVIALTTTHAADALRDAAVRIPDLRRVRVSSEAAGLVVRFGP